MRYNFFIIASIFTLFSFSQVGDTACSSSIQGVLIDNKSKQEVSNAKVSLVYSGKTISVIQSNEDGSYAFSGLECDKRYRIVVIKENFVEAIRLAFTSKKNGETQRIDIGLVPVQEFIVKDQVKQLVIREIDFYPDSFELTKEAKQELDLVYRILYKYPDLKIEIGFHTDSRGETEFLTKLTAKRAEVSRDYLVNKGIDESRIRAKGYGDSKLLNHCKKGVKCSNTQHLQNRRSEFIVIDQKD
jgi:outer membrane protein OmpA-like peptidoglycan-associated protein